MSLSRHAALAAVTLLLCAAVASAAPSFVARTDTPVTFIGPTALAAADFYGSDGITDIAVTYGLGKRVVLYRNDGNGNFTTTDVLQPPPTPDTSVESVVADKPTMIIAGDFNADTLPDIVGGNEGIQRFFAYRNPGTPGSWAAPLDTDARRGNAFDIVAAPWNSGPAADLVFCFPGRVGIALGEVDGGGVPTGVWGDLALFTATGFTAGTQTDIEVANFLQRPADPVAVMDILSVDYTGSQLIVWPGDPGFDGTVFVTAAEVKRFPVQLGATNLTPFEAIVNDWNGDGFPDALVATTEGYLLYFAGVGGTTVFAAEVVIDLAGSLALPAAPRAKTAWTSFVLADVTGDGIEDAVIADAGSATAELGFNWLTVVRGRSNFPQPTFTDGFGVADQWHYAAADLDKQRPGSLSVFDVDGDTDLDVVLLNADAVSMTTWRNDGTGHFDGAPSFPVGGPLPRGVAAGDLTGDGLAEVIAGISAPSDPAIRAPVVLPPDGAGGLRAPGMLGSAPSSATGAHGTSLVSVNTSQDALPDIVVTYSSDSYLWKGTGGSAFAAPLAMGIGAGEPRFGELSGTGFPDVALGDRAGNRILIWEGSGTGTFTLTNTIGSIYGYRDHAIGFFTGSDKMDIVVAGTSAIGETGLFFIDYNDATSTHLAPRFVRLVDLGLDLFTDVSRLAAGDFDNNGLTDLVGIASSGEGYFFRNTAGTLVLDLSVVVGAGGSPAGVAVGDVTLDGIVDLVVAGSNTVTVNEGASGSGFGSILSLPSNISNDSVGIGDLDGDSRPDLVAVSTRTADVTCFKNLSAAPLVLRLGTPATRNTLTWLDQGVGATYSVARGDLSLAWAARDLGDGTCLSSGLAATTLLDTDPLPPYQVPPSVFAKVAAWWYLVKCAGGDCSEPTFGQDSRGVDRFGGAAPPDPCP